MTAQFRRVEPDHQDGQLTLVHAILAVQAAQDALHG